MCMNINKIEKKTRKEGGKRWMKEITRESIIMVGVKGGINFYEYTKDS